VLPTSNPNSDFIQPRRSEHCPNEKWLQDPTVNVDRQLEMHPAIPMVLMAGAVQNTGMAFERAQIDQNSDSINRRCGATDAFCLVANGCSSGCTDVDSKVALTTPVTDDGTCGAAYGGMICGNWISGSCCSQYGWCGSRYGTPPLI
jgi:hypothetical protein